MKTLVAQERGRCACCNLQYPPGSKLHIEFDRYWVLDEHQVVIRETGWKAKSR